MIGHRGASSVFRENTVEAFRGAATLGADWVELDVRLTADGVPVVHHDPTIEDVETGPLVIAERDRTDLPPWVPTLADALTACEQPGARSGRPLGVNVEIKSWPTEPGYDPDHTQLPAILAVVAAHLSPERTLVSSFDGALLRAVRRLAPALPTALLVFEHAATLDAVAVAADAGHVALNPYHEDVTAEVVAAAHARGLAVYPWTVDDPARMAALLDDGVDGLITNVPDVAAAVVDGRG